METIRAIKLKSLKASSTPCRWFLRKPITSVLLCCLLLSCNRAPIQQPASLSPEQIPVVKAQAEKGAADAERTLGQLYAKGAGVNQDYTQAAKWYQLSAAQGNARAQVALGELYEAGQGVPHDEAQAANWYRRAAEQGLALAQYNLASLYAVGKGVPLDNSQALKWYLQAANLCDSLAQYNVGMRYFEGHGTASDPVLAYKWLSLASDQKVPDAQRALPSLQARMSSAQIAQARELVRQFKLATASKPSG